MTSALDMSLDDLIKNNKQTGRGGAAGRGRGAGGVGSAPGGAGGAGGGGGGGVAAAAAAAARGGGAYSGNGAAGPIRRVPRLSSRPSPYSAAQPAQRAIDAPWQHDLFEDDAGDAPVRPLGIETGTKLYISNLDYGVSNEDIKELFSEVGDLKRSAIHYDRSGRSKGTAEVVYSRKPDAVAAMKRYNNVQLDGKPMKIELIGTNLSVPTPATRALNGTAGGSRGGRTPGTIGARGRGGPVRRGRGRGRGRGGRGGTEKSVVELDAELEDYHAEAMQIS